jgi:DNA helicase-2/ATP-dependent DNA helicase PcrA
MRFTATERVQPAPESTVRVWSPQQQAVFAAVETSPRRDTPQVTSAEVTVASVSNLLVEAVAGSGKTTTLVEACNRMAGTVAFCAYNKKIADEIKVRVRGMSHVTAGTFHSFGFAAWRNANPGTLKVEGGKSRILGSQLGLEYGLRKFAAAGVAILKQAMIEPEAVDTAAYDLFDYYDIWDDLPEEYTQSDGIRACEELLIASIKESGRLIDFDDMIYMPLIKASRFPQFDWVLIDEAQDSNKVRRMLASEMLKPGGRILAVGDRHQAIYGFTGADNDALDIIKRDFRCVELPLTVTYRCPKAVVEHAREFVSHITAADNAPQGEVVLMYTVDFWKKEARNLRKDDAILCRNTRPLVSLAFELIRNNIGCHVEGREIGESLIKLVDKFPSARSLVELSKNLDDYLRSEGERLLAKGQDGKYAGLCDRIETLQVVIENLDGKGDPMEVKLKLSLLFGDTTPGQPSPSTTLATIHKAKGREWDRVFLWGRNLYMPSRFAKQQWQKQQENNLIYVAITRAKARLVEVSV